MEKHPVYRAKQFNLSGLKGISDKTLEMHFKLYEGYVEQTNVLHEKIAAFLRDGKIDQEEMPAYSELTRRLGFEYNGMVLHEYYFGNLRRAAGGDPARDATFRRRGRGELRQLRVEDGLRGGEDAWRRLGDLLSRTR
jgi:Fe-Mn family superoxide dismutase